MEIKELKNGACRSENIRKQFVNEVKEVFNGKIVPQLFQSDSCTNIDQRSQSGFYWLNNTDEPIQVYCSINETRCCNLESDGN